MIWLNRISSLFLMGFSALIFMSSLELQVGSLRSPGPGFMGFLSSTLLFTLSLIIFVKDIIRSDQDGGKESSVSGRDLIKPLVLAVLLFCYALLLETLGYLFSTFFLLFAMFFIDNPKRWLFHIFVALITANLTYLVFYKTLRVMLPKGIIGIGW